MKIFLFLVTIFISVFFQQGFAQGGLLITPKRVVFEGNKQKTEINLMNTGTDTALYSVSLRNYKMTEDGRLELIEVPDTGKMSAEPYLRFFPRQVTLAPGESQVIALQCRRTPGMAPGEYRSHLWFRDEKNYKPLEKEKPLAETNQLSVSLIAKYGITIPVIIRSGAVNTGATLTALKLETGQDSTQYLKLTINRTGNISIDGKLTAEYYPLMGKPLSAGLMNVGVYTNISKRSVAIKLNRIPGATLTGGKVKVRYTSRDGEKYVLYAEAELVL